MATSCGLDAGPGSLRRRILTRFLALLLVPLPPNLGYKEDGSQSVCGIPWWLDKLETMHHWPWEVSVRMENEHVCGGALIDGSWVVSAAHCIQGNKEYSVLLGSRKLQPASSPGALKIPVRDIIVHPKYWGRNFIRNDLALLRLDAPVTFSKYVHPICLPEQSFSLEVETQCWVTGWGQGKQHSSGNRTLTPVLHEVKVFIIDSKRCDRVFHKKSLYPPVLPLIQRNMICATSNGENLCYGDPGGPLACEVDGRWILAGVSSLEEACIKPQNPGVYTLLTKYTNWIQKQVNHGVLLGPCRASWLLFLSWLLQLPIGL
ncbi:inactive serine protease 45-like [Psammomys obesus]|uniref:inactive serine protease 45-like n=1 Tax=Psammomys obesus TaxID=48139 RepID=UPI002452EB55|nr:inactive serine protease 45-like [Psammomys obesus]